METKEIREIKDKLNEHGGLLQKIYISVAGDDGLKIRGMNHRLDDHEQRIGDLEEYRDTHKGSQNRFKWMGIGAMGGAGFVGGAIGSGTAKTFFTGAAKFFISLFMNCIIILLV